MEFELKGALKKYRRMRGWRRFILTAVCLAGIAAPWFYGLSRTDTLICFTGALVVYLCGELEFRLKTIQIRLAGMDDELRALRGKEEESSLVLELNDW